ncbi:hypothetical protein NLU13_8951 [Sarocladium strictum]|uniref:Uncharacterized protein n=1 Tax=Sarocladium strictum TaxID=5046 RepID=A0AA39G991_SARSR|nr:hypothetical protein NLU13_8951 [Sarocladium strictum]
MAAASSLFAGLRKPDHMASFAPRRFYYLIVIWLAVATLLLLGNHYLGSSSVASSWHFPHVTDDGTLSLPSWSHRGGSQGTKLRIALLEAAGVHDEVTSALVHAFGGQRDVELMMYQQKQRYNMSAIVDEFKLPSPIRNITSPPALRNDTLETPPHVVVSTTCELDTQFRQDVFETLLTESNSYLFCLCHHADQWITGSNVDMVKRFAAQGRLDMIALSNHTGEYLRTKSIPTWEEGASVRIRVLPPIFPANGPGPKNAAELNLAMQGDFSSERRNYQRIFSGLSGVVDKVNTLPTTDNVTLHLLGHGKKPKVPDEIRDRVAFDEDLSYPDFYAILSTAYAVLPAFATDHYFDRKASSTVPASIIAGAPLVASKQLLESYTYLPREATWEIQEGESELDTVRRIVGDQVEFAKKRWLIASTRERLLKENIANVHTWLVEALRRL